MISGLESHSSISFGSLAVRLPESISIFTLDFYVRHLSLQSASSVWIFTLAFHYRFSIHYRSSISTCNLDLQSRHVISIFNLDMQSRSSISTCNLDLQSRHVISILNHASRSSMPLARIVVKVSRPSSSSVSPVNLNLYSSSAFSILNLDPQSWSSMVDPQPSLLNFNLHS